MRQRSIAYGFTAAIMLLSFVTLTLQGLNFGLDFVGGIVVEARAPGAVEPGPLRQKLDAAGLGDVSLQTFGSDRDLLIRAREQPGGPQAQQDAIATIKALLTGYEIRTTEFIGPQVSHELLRNGILAAVLSVVFIAVYVWFRFEWQFGVAALVTIFHDVLATFGFFALFQLEFNLTVVAAILTIAGYSVNDTVVVFDRIRENLRRYKSMPMFELIELSINQTLARTVMTSGTTLVAVLALLIFGGPVLRNFSLAITWGILIGTYSSVFVAAALLLHLPSLRSHEETGNADESPKQEATPRQQGSQIS